MQLKDIMTANPECIAPNATLEQAARMMRDLDIGVLPVCGEDDSLVGMITDRDIVIRAVAGGRDPKIETVQRAMSDDVVYGFEEQDVDDAARVMEQRQIRRLLVLNKDKALVGIVSLGDLAIEPGARIVAAEVLREVSEPVASH